MLTHVRAQLSGASQPRAAIDAKSKNHKKTIDKPSYTRSSALFGALDLVAQNAPRPIARASGDIARARRPRGPWPTFLPVRSGLSATAPRHGLCVTPRASRSASSRPTRSVRSYLTPCARFLAPLVPRSSPRLRLGRRAKQPPAALRKTIKSYTTKATAKAKAGALRAPTTSSLESAPTGCFIVALRSRGFARLRAARRRRAPLTLARRRVPKGGAYASFGCFFAWSSLLTVRSVSGCPG